MLLASYKLGEAVIDTMFKPLLVDQGFTAAQIGRWNGATRGLLGTTDGTSQVFTEWWQAFWARLQALAAFCLL